MTDQLLTLSPLPPQPDPMIEGLIAAGIYERVAPDRCRMSEAGLRWFLSWLPRVLDVLVARSRTPAMEKYVELVAENRRLAAELEKARREAGEP